MKKHRRIVMFFVGVLGFCLVSSVYVQAASDREMELEKTVKELLQRVAELESRVEKGESAQESLSEQVQQTQEEKENPNEVKTSWKNGLSFESADGANSVTIGGRVQNDWYTGDIDGGDFPDGTRFRRIWLKVGGKLYDDFKYKVQYDLAGNGIARWKDIWVEYTALDFMNIRAGLFKEPFSMEELMFNRDLSFLERASLNALVPSRNTGFMVYNSVLDDRLRWEAGLFKSSNDFGDGEEDDAVEGDWDATLRLSGLPWYEDDGKKLLHLGAAFSHREWSDDPLRFRSRGSYSRGDRLVDTGVFNADTIDLFGAELGMNYGPFNLMSEYVHANVDATGSGSDNYDSFYVQGSYFLTGESRPYKDGMWTRVKPKNNFSLKDGGWGAWEIGFRYSYMDLTDTPVIAAAGGKLDDYTLGLNWYLNPNTRVMWNYVHSESSDTTAADRDADILQMRLQFDF